MNLFLNAALLVAAFMALVTVWLAVERPDEAAACPGWWIFPSAVLGALIIAGVLL